MSRGGGQYPLVVRSAAVVNEMQFFNFGVENDCDGSEEEQAVLVTENSEDAMEEFNKQIELCKQANYAKEVAKNATAAELDATTITTTTTAGGNVGGTPGAASSRRGGGSASSSSSSVLFMDQQSQPQVHWSQSNIEISPPKYDGDEANDTDDGDISDAEETDSLSRLALKRRREQLLGQLLPNSQGTTASTSGRVVNRSVQKKRIDFRDYLQTATASSAASTKRGPAKRNRPAEELAENSQVDAQQSNNNNSSTTTNSTVSVKTLYDRDGKEFTAEVSVLVDTREKSRTGVQPLDQFKAVRGVKGAVLAHLASGDFALGCNDEDDFSQNPPTTTTDLNCQLLPLLVERKKWDDLNHSVKDKRYTTQKRAMLASGLKLPLLLGEGKPLTKPEDRQRCESAMLTTFLVDGFHVVWSMSQDETSHVIGAFARAYTQLLRDQRNREGAQLAQLLDESSSATTTTKHYSHDVEINTPHWTTWREHVKAAKEQDEVASVLPRFLCAVHNCSKETALFLAPHLKALSLRRVKSLLPSSAAAVPTGAGKEGGGPTSSASKARRRMLEDLQEEVGQGKSMKAKLKNVDNTLQILEILLSGSEYT